MKHVNILLGAVLGLLSLATTGVAAIGDPFAAPFGGWAYTYEGDADSAGEPDGTKALDTKWTHGWPASDQWDGTRPGDPIVPNDPNNPGAQRAPGGVIALVDGDDGTGYLRIQDPGEPSAGNPGFGFLEPSNKKIHFVHDLKMEDPGINTKVLNTGFTLSFRARLSTVAADPNAPLDDVYDRDQAAPLPWPAEGSGYPIANTGRAMFNVSQSGVGSSELLGFSLITQADLDEDSITGASPGLIMNNESGPVAIGSGVDSNESGTKNVLPLDDAELTEWHEFWITVRRDPTGVGTHQVEVFRDGFTGRNMVDTGDPNDPNDDRAATSTFSVTAALNDDFPEDAAYIATGMSSGSRFGAYDLDFLSYKNGYFLPPEPGDMDIDGDSDFDDIPVFVTALTKAQEYTSLFGVPPSARGDTDGDGDHDFDDIPGFVALLTGSDVGLQGVPEPSTLAIALLLSGTLVSAGWLARFRRGG